MKVELILKVGHQYLEDINAFRRKNQQQAALCHVHNMIEKILNLRFKRYFLPIITTIQCLTRLD